MSTHKLNENNIEALSLRSPEFMTEQRKGIISMAVANLRSHARVEAQTVERSVLSQSAEVNTYEQSLASSVVAEAERIAKDAAELFEDRARHDALNSFTGFEQNPLFELEDHNA